jgi:hypothetical protein
VRGERKSNFFSEIPPCVASRVAHRLYPREFALARREILVVLAREDVNATQKRTFYLNYGVGCRAESNPVFVRWSSQTTNQLR